MLLALVTSLLLSGQGVSPLPAILFTPSSAVEGAYNDQVRIRTTTTDSTTIRYLCCYYARSLQELEEHALLADIAVNSLNFHKRTLVPCIRLEGGRLLRVDLYALGIDPKTWDRLGREGSGPAPFPEPYFHQQLESVQTTQTQTVETVEKRWYPGGHDQGQYYPPGYYHYRVKKFVQVVPAQKHTILAQASWLNREKLVKLVQWCETEFPILRCDWFVVYALQPPAYLWFQGNPKKRADYQQLAAVDVKASERTASQLRGATLFSEVANRNRALERTPLGFNYGRGYYWESYDFLASIKDKDLLKNLLQKKRDAGEIIWSLPNGLQGYGLINGEDKVLEFADPRVAVDNRTLLRDKVVYSGWKCIFCHAEGIIPIADEVRLSSRDFLGFLVPDKKQAERVADLYFGEEINRLVVADQQNYTIAVQSLTRKAPAAVALSLQQLFQKYLDEPVTLETVCLDTGYPLSAVESVIAETARVALDHTYVRMLRKRQGRRDQHEAAFASLMQVLSLTKERR